MALPEGINGVFYGIGIVIALLNCFLGHRLLKFWCLFVSFFIGAILGFSISVQITNSTPISTLIAVIVGIAFVGIVIKTYHIGLFLLCGVLTYVIVQLLFSSLLLSVPEIAVRIIGITAGILIGSMAVKSADLIVILITGISGGLSAGHSLNLLFHLTNPVIATLVGVIISAAGIVFQWRKLKSAE